MRKHRNIIFNIEVRLDAEDISDEDLYKLTTRMKINAKKAIYDTGTLYRSVVVKTTKGLALPIPKNKEELTAPASSNTVI